MAPFGFEDLSSLISAGALAYILIATPRLFGKMSKQTLYRRRAGLVFACIMAVLPVVFEVTAMVGTAQIALLAASLPLLWQRPGRAVSKHVFQAAAAPQLANRPLLLNASLKSRHDTAHGG